jgi:MFS family permease
MTENAAIGSARRAAQTLSAAQAIIGAAGPISVSLGGLAGLSLLGSDKTLATAPVTAFTVGMAVAALPAAMLMRSIGRRDGFLTGAVVTALGGGVAAFALFRASFWLFTIAILLIGAGGAFLQQYRFAAADNAPAEYRSSAISWVLAGGIFAAIIGPQTVIYTSALLAPVMFAGSFVAVIGLAAIGALILSTLKLNTDLPSVSSAPETLSRPLPEIVLQPRFLVALICGVGAYAMMSFVMTGAPLAIVSCGFSPNDATLGISWHMMAMFAPSFVTGRLIARFGELPMLALGMLLLIGSAAVGLSGIALWQFWTNLILLGVGWNFAFISATTMVTESYLESEKSKVQGFHDFVLFGTVAFASLMSGRVFVSYGWYTVNVVVFPAAVICLTALAWLILKGRGANAVHGS